MSQYGDVDVPDQIEKHPAWRRLVSQIEWYSRKSQFHQLFYKWTKTAQIVLASAIPLLAFIESLWSKWLTAGCGALIAILEGFKQLGQHSSLWITYRATAEFLKHEKYLFLAAAGPYRDRPESERLILLAERVEERVSSEHANWVNETRKRIKQSGTKGTAAE